MKKSISKRKEKAETPKKYSDDVIEKTRSCGRVSFPVLDTCRMLRISIDDFSASKELMDTYRNAQLETALEIRTRLLESIEKYPDTKTIKLFVEQFLGTVLPDPDEEM